MSPVPGSSSGSSGKVLSPSHASGSGSHGYSNGGSSGGNATPVGEVSKGSVKSVLAAAQQEARPASPVNPSSASSPTAAGSRRQQGCVRY